MEHLAYVDHDGLMSLATTMTAWRQQHPAGGMLVLLPEPERGRVAEVQAAARACGLPLVGAIFPALVGAAGFCQAGAWLIGFKQMPPHFLLPHMQQADAADRLAAAVRPHCANGAAAGVPNLFLILDGMLPDISTLLLGVYEQLRQAVRYGGVNAGSERFQPMPCLFDETRVLGDAVLGLLLPAGSKMVAEHCYPVSRSLKKATSTQGNRIDTIDGRPAFAVYRELIQAEYGVTVTRENFYDYAVHFPFGIVTALDVLVRIPVALDDDDSLHCVGEIPPNSMLRLLRAPAAEDDGCIELVARHLAPAMGAEAGSPLLVFYCAGRRMHFGAEAAGAELRALCQRVGARAVAGALTLGEIDSEQSMGLPRFHNATIVGVR